MNIDEIKDIACDMGFENSIFFEDPSYQSAIIGISSNGNVCYDYDAMIDSLVKDDGMDENDAIDFVNSDTLRVLDYLNASDNGIPPVVIYKFDK